MIRRSSRSSTVLLAAALASGVACAADSAVDVRVDNPRAFGHFIGDALARTLQVTVPPGYTLEAASLPAPARATPWMELLAVDAQPRAVNGGTRYRIELEYQIVNSPREPQLVALPSLDLRFAGAAPFATHVDEWPIALAPLGSSSIRMGLEELKPSRPPRSIDAGSTEAWLAAYASAAAMLIAWLTVERWTRPVKLRRAGPFARAQRRLRELREETPGVERDRAAFRALHRAFDETAGARVFASGLEEWFAAHPQHRELAAAARAFFADSQATFFGDEPAPTHPRVLEGLSALAEGLARGERRRPRTAPQKIAVSSS